MKNLMYTYLIKINKIYLFFKTNFYNALFMIYFVVECIRARKYLFQKRKKINTYVFFLMVKII